MFGFLASLFVLFLNNSPARVGAAIQTPTNSGSTQPTTIPVVSADSSTSNDGGTGPTG